MEFNERNNNEFKEFSLKIDINLQHAEKFQKMIYSLRVNPSVKRESLLLRVNPTLKSELLIRGNFKSLFPEGITLVKRESLWFRVNPSYMREH